MTSRRSNPAGSAAITTTQQLQLLLNSVPPGHDRPSNLSEIAQTVGLSVQTLAKLVSGQTADPRLDTLRRLCQYYRVSLDYFSGQTLTECQAYLNQQRLAAASSVIHEIARQTDSLSQRSQGNIQLILRWLEADQLPHS